MSVSQACQEPVAGPAGVPVRAPSGLHADLVGRQGHPIQVPTIPRGLLFHPRSKACLATIAGPIIAAHQNDPFVSDAHWPASNPATALMAGADAKLSLEASRSVLEGLDTTEKRRTEAAGPHVLSIPTLTGSPAAGDCETSGLAGDRRDDMCGNDLAHFGDSELPISDPSVASEHPARNKASAEASTQTPATFAIFADNPIVVVPHQSAMEVPYGTIATWINPCSTDGIQTLIALDELQSGDCGRFRMAMDSDRVTLRLSSPYDGCLYEWVSEKPVFKPGVWTHVAATFDNQGVTLFADGVALEDRSWCPVAGPLETPGAMIDFSLENNRHAMVLGCGACAVPALPAKPDLPDATSEPNEPGCKMDGDGAEFEVFPFTGLIAEYGLWGGFSPSDALNAEQIAALANKKPAADSAGKAVDAALSNSLRDPNRRRDPAQLRSRNWTIARKRPTVTVEGNKSAKVHSWA